MNVNLNNHPIWKTFDKILRQIDTKALAMGHLESCNYKLSGYWDGDEFYEEIAFVSPLHAELTNSALGKSQIDHRSHRWMRLQFLLKPDVPPPNDGDPVSNHEEIGELTLVLDSEWRIVDENWIIDVESPFVLAKKAQDC